MPNSYSMQRWSRDEPNVTKYFILWIANECELYHLNNCGRHLVGELVNNSMDSYESLNRVSLTKSFSLRSFVMEMNSPRGRLVVACVSQLLSLKQTINKQLSVAMINVLVRDKINSLDKSLLPHPRLVKGKTKRGSYLWKPNPVSIEKAVNERIHVEQRSKPWASAVTFAQFLFSLRRERGVKWGRNHGFRICNKTQNLKTNLNANKYVLGFSFFL